MSAEVCPVSYTHLDVYKRQELKIQNYKKILQYSPKEMILLLKSKRLVIQGDHLDIYYFNADEVCIRGHIVSIMYQSG